jgi:2,3-bisphosphoglycerate-independent phosphoglycerate mutase
MSDPIDPTLEPYLKAVLGKKAEQIVLLDVNDLTSLAETFVICSGRSNRQVSAIAEFIRTELKKQDIRPLHVEGIKEGHWVLMDYGHVIIHIFYGPIREFYDLEGLWIDAKRIPVSGDDTEEGYHNIPIMLAILDGWGVGPERKGNAVFEADTPFLDSLMKAYPNTTLLCSGKAVGLPEGIMGNSEVGHLNIGAGRIVYQDLLRIDMSIKSGEFYDNPALSAVMSKVREKDATLHLIGLVSDGGVHSQLTHLTTLIEMAGRKGLKKIDVHAILDGRDTPPDSGIRYVTQLKEFTDATGIGNIATICGRYYAMDRDNRWDRVEKAYRLYTLGEGIYEKDPLEAVKNAYQRDESDEFVRPIAITSGAGSPTGTVKNGDGVIFFNFRADRAREITRALTDPAFDMFPRDTLPALCGYVCMTIYDESFSLPVAFPPVRLEQILGQVISDQGLRQLRIAETEKYAHVTYFFNGGEEKPFPLEDRCLIPSPKNVATYDLKPEMSALKVTEEILPRIRSGKYDFIVLNFANMDMVGHTGMLAAAVSACETVDTCLEKIVIELKRKNGTVLITADHGNAEKMMEDNGQMYTAHTTHPVPFILVDDKRKNVRLRAGALADIAPTILDIMGIRQPEQMTGKSLIEGADHV